MDISVKYQVFRQDRQTNPQTILSTFLLGRSQGSYPKGQVGQVSVGIQEVTL